jgi:cellulose synthase/poly-beta-1,6-N-acetylglucosamine synthase-like glycosyltransferase
VVYVDSGSMDDSVAFARSRGVDVVLLDSSIPFTAARARNVGFERLCEIFSDIALVQFVDGDCELAPDWLQFAQKYLSANSSIAVVCGHLRELHPEASVYNRLGDIEWQRPSGDIEYCGGIFMIRVDVFKEVGGFDPSISAGEEPDLCCRLRSLGMRIVRIDQAMATHDLNMLRFSQWWKRSVRGGYAALKLTLFGPLVSRGVYRRQVQGVLVWGIILPAILGTSMVVASVLGFHVMTLAILLIGFGLFGLQIVRIATNRMRSGTKMSVAIAYGGFMILWKFAAVEGFVQCLFDRFRNSWRSAVPTKVRVFHKSS